MSDFRCLFSRDFSHISHTEYLSSFFRFIAFQTPSSSMDKYSFIYSILPPACVGAAAGTMRLSRNMETSESTQNHKKQTHFMPVLDDGNEDNCSISCFVLPVVAFDDGLFTRRAMLSDYWKHSRITNLTRNPHKAHTIFVCVYLRRGGRGHERAHQEKQKRGKHHKNHQQENGNPQTADISELNMRQDKEKYANGKRNATTVAISTSAATARENEDVGENRPIKNSNWSMKISSIFIIIRGAQRK